METNFMVENPLASLALAILLIYVLKLIWNATADKCHQKKEPKDNQLRMFDDDGTDIYD
jgi:hypothetical protein